MSETISKGKGPSALDKGKGVDPHNWGALSEVSEDLDLDGQRAALASWNLVHNLVHSSAKNSQEESNKTHLIKKDRCETKGKCACKAYKQNEKLTPTEEVWTKSRALIDQPAKGKHRTKGERRKDTAERKNLSPVKAMVDKAITLSDKPQKHHRTPKAMEPVEQIDPESYIGLAFKHLDKEAKTMRKKQRGRSSPPDMGLDSSTTSSGSLLDEDELSDSSSDSSSTSSSPNGTDLSSTSSMSTVSCLPRRRRRHHGHNRRHGHSRRQSESQRARQKSRRKSRKMMLKPVPPLKYDGSADLKAFHRFMMEGTAYVKDGNVPDEKQVFMIAHYVTVSRTKQVWYSEHGR